MKPQTFETVYRNGLIELPVGLKLNESMRVLVVFLDDHKSTPKLNDKFSFAKSLELTKNCSGIISDLIVAERRN